MPRSRNYIDEDRFDSVVDLPRSQHVSHGNRNTTFNSSSSRSHDPSIRFTTSQTVATSSVMAPWSQYNTRLPSYQLDPGHPTSIVNPYIYTDFDSQNFSADAYEEVYLSNSPSPRYASPEAATASSCSDFSTFPTNRPVYNHNALCEQCSTEFTGTYRWGNLKRHIKHKHLEAKEGSYPCKAVGCLKIFQRRDAQLKHVRQKHPELCPPPMQRRRGTEHYPTAIVNTMGNQPIQDINYNVGQWLPDECGSLGYFSARMQGMFNVSTDMSQLPGPVRDVFSILKTKLHPVDYSRRCDSSFTRWENIVQQLKDDQSDAHPVYARVLEDIRAVVDTFEAAAYVCASVSSGSCSRPPNQRTGPRDTGLSGSGSQTGRISKRNGRTPSLVGGTGGQALPAIGKHRKKVDGRKVDCPVYKHHRMYNTASPCQGCSVNVMSQIRSHLDPNRAARHNGFPEFVEQCSRCKQDFVERHVYDNHKAAQATENTCKFRVQSRGDIVIPWARQYLALYPDATRIPVPWTDEYGWLPDDVLEQCRPPPAGPTIASPFLGDRQNHSSFQLQMLPVVNEPPDGPGYHSAMGHVLGDIMNPNFIQSSRSSSPVRNLDRSTGASLEVPFVGADGTNAQHWQSLLESFEIHQRTMREAATHLRGDQLQFMARESERVFHISEGIYQQHQLQPIRNDQSPAFAYHDSWTEGTTTVHASSTTNTGSTILATPNQSMQIPALSYEQITTPSSSTQQSSRSIGTRSSGNHNSPFTDLSSTHGSIDPVLLSPYSPSDRRPSLPYGRSEDSVRLRRVPSRRSLPDNPQENIEASPICPFSSEQDPDYKDHFLYKRYD